MSVTAAATARPVDDPAPLSVALVVPVFGNAETLSELHRRADAALGPRLARLIFVDDASPDAAAAEISALAAQDPRVEGVALERNVGQHRAVLAGLERARDADRVVVLDADLQDPPEAIPALVDHSRNGVDVVFAGRRGRYQSFGRRVTSRVFKRTLSAMLGVPRDAGMFMALTPAAVRSLLEMEGPPPFVVAMVGASGLRSTSVPVERSARPGGDSAYGSLGRLRSAVRGLRWVAWRRGPGATRTVSGRDRHNAGQRRYFSRPDAKQGMRPRTSRYLARQIDEVFGFAGLAPGMRVLEVGCGMGRYTLDLADRGLTVEGIDLSPELLGRLRPEAERRGVTLHRGDVIDPPAELRPGFDAAIGFFVLHHLHDVAGCLRSIGTLVRPGGWLAFVEPNPFNPLYYVQIAIRPGMTWQGDRGIVRMRRGPLFEGLAGAGVSEPRLERFGFFPPQIADLRGSEALERRIEGFAPLAPMLPFQLLGGRVETPSGSAAPRR